MLFLLGSVSKNADNIDILYGNTPLLSNVVATIFFLCGLDSRINVVQLFNTNLLYFFSL